MSDPLQSLREAADRLEARLLSRSLTASPSPLERDAAALIRSARETVRALSPDASAARSPLARTLEATAAACLSAVRDPSPYTLEQAGEWAAHLSASLEARNRKAAAARTSAPPRRTV